MEILEQPSPHCDERTADAVVDTVVIHSMHNPECADGTELRRCIERLDQFQVSAHYLIDRAGAVARLVPESKRAWHAGVSRMHDGREGVNQFSLGVELLARDDEGFTQAQYQSLFILMVRLIRAFPLKYVVGHDHIAQPPGRKSDPGPQFDWEKVRRLLHSQYTTKDLEFPFLER